MIGGCTQKEIFSLKLYINKKNKHNDKIKLKLCYLEANLTAITE